MGKSLFEFGQEIEGRVDMKIYKQEFIIKGMVYLIRLVEERDVELLFLFCVQIDGEIDNMDWEQGEVYIDVVGFRSIIWLDIEKD